MSCWFVILFHLAVHWPRNPNEGLILLSSQWNDELLNKVSERPTAMLQFLTSTPIISILQWSTHINCDVLDTGCKLFWSLLTCMDNPYHSLVLLLMAISSSLLLMRYSFNWWRIGCLLPWVTDRIALPRSREWIPSWRCPKYSWIFPEIKIKSMVQINLVTKMRLGGRCLGRKSPSGAEDPGKYPWQPCTAHHQDGQPRW